MIFRTSNYITHIQNYYDTKGAMRKCLPHLATRSEDVAREVLGFLCIMLFNANAQVQVHIHVLLRVIMSFEKPLVSWMTNYPCSSVDILIYLSVKPVLICDSLPVLFLGRF